MTPAAQTLLRSTALLLVAAGLTLLATGFSAAGDKADDAAPAGQAATVLYTVSNSGYIEPCG